MIKTVVIALSGALIAAASPALADTGRVPAAPNVASASSTALVDAPVVKPAVSKQRYCISVETTGSHLTKKICRTREQWLDQGFDPLAK